VFMPVTVIDGNLIDKVLEHKGEKS